MDRQKLTKLKQLITSNESLERDIKNYESEVANIDLSIQVLVKRKEGYAKELEGVTKSLLGNKKGITSLIKEIYTELELENNYNGDLLTKSFEQERENKAPDRLDREVF